MRDYGMTLPDDPKELAALKAAIEAKLEEKAKEPDWICSGVPDEAVEAGIAAWDKANHDLANYVSGVTPDWDEGMIVCAIYKAMAPLTPVAEPFDVEALAQELAGKHALGSEPFVEQAAEFARLAIRETLRRLPWPGEAERDELKAERQRICHNKRINDAMQTSIERGLIALEPELAEADHAWKICEDHGYVHRNSREHHLATAALKRGIELAPRVELTRKMVQEAVAPLRYHNLTHSDIDRLHAAIQEQLKGAGRG